MSRKHIEEVKCLLESLYSVADIMEEKGIHPTVSGFSEKDRLRDIMQKDVISFILRLLDDGRHFNYEAVLFFSELLNRQLREEHVEELMKASKEQKTPSVSIVLPYMIFIDSQLGRNDISATYIRALGSTALVLFELLDNVELDELIRYNKNCRDCAALVEKSLGIKMDYDPLERITSDQRELVKYAAMAGNVVNGNEKEGVNATADMLKRIIADKNTEKNEEDKTKKTGSYRRHHKKDDEWVVEDLELSSESCEWLKSAGIGTVEELYSKRVSELRSNSNYTRSLFDEVLRKLNDEYVRKYGPGRVRTMYRSSSGIPIEVLDLSIRSYNCLKRTGYDTVEALLCMSDEDFHKVRNLGKKCIVEVTEKVKGFLYSDEWNRYKGKQAVYHLSTDEKVLGKNINEMNLYERTYNYLARNRINTIGDMSKLTFRDIRRIHRFDHVICETVLSILRRYDFMIKTIDWDSADSGSELIVADDILLNRDIDCLDIRLKTLLCLKNAGIHKMGDLCSMMAYEVMSIYRMEPMELVQIEKALKEYKLSFMEY